MYVLYICDQWSNICDVIKIASCLIYNGIVYDCIPLIYYCQHKNI